MRLRTNLTGQDIRAALQRAQEAGTVAAHVELDNLVEHRAQRHARGFELHLSTRTKDRNEAGKVRRPCNSGQYGAGQNYSASYAEWGHVMAEVFKLDPGAVFGPYRGREDFYTKTRGQFGAMPAGSQLRREVRAAVPSHGSTERAGTRAPMRAPGEYIDPCGNPPIRYRTRS